jgi:cytochrome c-type biogenesis protein CcmE
MKVKMILATLVIVGFVIFGATSFMQNNLEYTNVSGAKAKHKKVQLKGEWDKDRGSSFDQKTSQFTFFLKDESGETCKVILDGAAPNNFELATSVVAKGRFTDEGYFHATEVLTKCPSKYEATGADVKRQS